jgi:hypothetical protein
MIYKDFYCTMCEIVVRDVPVQNCDDIEIFSYCKKCMCETSHKSVCNGGLKQRYRFCDFPLDDDDFWKGKIKAIRPTAENKDGDVKSKSTGELMHNDSRFKGDKRAERKDKIESKRKRKLGRNKIIIDQKQK